MRSLAALIVSFAMLGACSSDSGPSDSVVDGAAAITALVDWVVDELPPVENDAIEIEPPVVYVTNQNGETMDAALQASVVEATADTATVRFADDRSEAIDVASDVDAVRDAGVMLVVGEMPEAARVIDLDVERYGSTEDSTTFVVQITGAQSGATVTRSSSG